MVSCPLGPGYRYPSYRYPSNSNPPANSMICSSRRLSFALAIAGLFTCVGCHDSGNADRAVNQTTATTAPDVETEDPKLLFYHKVYDREAGEWNAHPVVENPDFEVIKARAGNVAHE